MTPDLGSLQAFVAVVECGGFAEAARRLVVSPSMISRRVAALEAQLGTQLVLRTTRGMALTEAGERLHPRCRELMAELALACEEASGGVDRLAGRVRLTAPQSLIGAALVAPVVADLLRRHPGLHFDIALDERKLDLVSGAFDVALRLGPLPDSRSYGRLLAALHGQFVASPAYLARHGTPRSTDELVRHVALEHAELGPQGLWRIADAEPPHQRVRANSIELLLDLARAGAGIAVMPPFVVRGDLEQGRLQLLLPQWRSPTFELFAVAPPASRLSARVRLVIDALVAYAARPVETWGAPV
jgi:DNA-binding transcriptional LysR family regulator